MQNTYDNPRKQGGGFQGLVFQGAKEKEKFPPFFSLMFPPTPPFFIYIISPRKRKRKKKERKRACTHVREAYFFWVIYVTKLWLKHTN